MFQLLNISPKAGFDPFPLPQLTDLHARSSYICVVVVVNVVVVVVVGGGGGSGVVLLGEILNTR